MSQRTNVAIALIGLLLLPTTSAQAPSVTDAPSDCTNNGVIVQAGGGSSTINCEGECTNNGVVVQASASSAYTCDGGCTNNGIIVWGPRADGHTNSCGSGPYQHLGGACVGEVCVLPHLCDPTICDPRIVNDLIGGGGVVTSGYPFLQICAIDQRPTPPTVTCAHANDCAVLQNPACWTLRLTCTMADNQTRIPEILERYGVHCTSWDTSAPLLLA